MRPLTLVLCCLAVLALSACGGRNDHSSKLQVVAAENFWGSIAAQLGGTRTTVRSIIVNPATDPHSYEPTPSDARTFAGAKVAIVNGIGYDNWASQLIASNPVSGRSVVSAGDVLGLGEGDNPHQWYSPASVEKMVAAIVAAFDKTDPAGYAYFAARERAFETRSLARYHALLAEIKRHYQGVPVGYSESIFQPLGLYLGLTLLTPYSFAKSIAEGTDVSAQDVETVEGQARDRQIKVWVYNSQNVTPEVSDVTAIARREHIPVVTVTETLSPASLDFEQWQARQLTALLGALHRATG